MRERIKVSRLRDWVPALTTNGAEYAWQACANAAPACEITTLRPAWEVLHPQGYHALDQAQRVAYYADPLWMPLVRVEARTTRVVPERARLDSASDTTEWLRALRKVFGLPGLGVLLSLDPAVTEWWKGPWAGWVNLVGRVVIEASERTPERVAAPGFLGDVEWVEKETQK